MKPSERINGIIDDLVKTHGVTLTAGVICTAIIKYLDEKDELKKILEAPGQIKKIIGGRE